MTVLARAPGGACAVVPRAGLQAPRVAVRGGNWDASPVPTRAGSRGIRYGRRNDDMDAYKSQYKW